MRLAYKYMNERGMSDPDIDLNGKGGPAFGNHSWRRYADKIAQRWKHLTLVDILGKDAAECKAMINYVFGWDLDKMYKDMQMWYANKDAVDRAELSMVTLMA